MGWTNQLVSLILLSAQQAGFSGLFVYSPAPGPGNLIASIAAQAGTDPYGNAYRGSGFATYGIAGQALLGNGFLTLYDPANGNVVGQVNVSAGTVRAFYLQVNAGLYQLMSDPIAAVDGSGNPEAWHYVGGANSLGTAFGAAWGNLGGTSASLAFRRVASPARKVEIQGVIATTGTAPNNNVFTLPAGYLPAKDQRFGTATSAAPAAACLVQVSAAGVVQVSGAPGGVATTVGIDVSVSQDL